MAEKEMNRNGSEAFNRGLASGQNNENSPTGFQPSPDLMGALLRGQTARPARGAQAGLDPDALSAINAAQRPGAARRPDTRGPIKPPIGPEQVRKAMHILEKYKRGKQQLEHKIINNERWWRKRHWEMMESEKTHDDPKPASGWLFNTIISKHADFMDNFPGTSILPREPDDVQEARSLSSIIPVVMDQVGYRKVFSDEVWYKLIHGTGVFGVFWDQSLLNGLGDISVKKVDLLSLFWEPGVLDIQQSQNVFSVELVDNDLIEQRYPQTRGELSKTNDTIIKKYYHDDTGSIDTTGKSAVVDWYYKKEIGGKTTLQYVKFVDDIVLYATENEVTPPMEQQVLPVPGANGEVTYQTAQVPVGKSMAERGLYDHGKYPFVFDVLFPIASMPVGFGFVDVCKDAQASIDIYNNAFEKNIQYVCSPRYLVRNDGGLNEEEFVDPNTLIVHTDGNLSQDSYIPIATPAMISGNYISLLDQKINEMKETAGNRDAVNGGTSAGVTAASAIAAMQEASGKTSRDQISTSFDAHREVVTIIIELIRQFYDMPRQFRIIGQHGQSEFLTYDNQGLQPRYQGVEYGVDLGYRTPMFDIEVIAEKQSSYSRLSQNELALQFYSSGFFNPQYSDQVLACLEMMEFRGKQEMQEKVEANGTMYDQLMQMQQQMMQMAEMIDQLTGGQYGMAEGLASDVNARLDAQAAGSTGAVRSNAGRGNSLVQQARERAAEVTNPT